LIFFILFLLLPAFNTIAKSTANTL